MVRRRWGFGLLVLGFVSGCLGRSDIDETELASGGSGGGVDGGATGGAGAQAGFGGSGAFAGASASGGTGAGAGNGGSAAGGSGASGGTGASGGSGGSGGGCGPQSCDGCCDLSGGCRSGAAVNACGRSGVDCADCAVLGFDCVGGQCQGVTPECGPDTCDGCCDDQGLCRFGSETDACGSRGGVCQDCGSEGLGCDADGQCEGPPPPTCGPSNCGGCCSGNSCQGGGVDVACGRGGEACENCASNGRDCVQPQSYCGFVPTCGPNTCPAGCCDSEGVCQDGRTDATCGADGQVCQSCASQGLACAPQGFCFAGEHCGPDNCAGCCTTSGQCRNGAGNQTCGQFGSLCDNCANKGETCQGNVCSDGSVCPAAYSGCIPTASTPPPFSADFCSSQNLEQLRDVCSSGSEDDCGQAFQSLLSQNPGCYDCMLQFTGDNAYTRCLAPFLDSNCNHDLTCAIDCQNDSCRDCADDTARDICQDGLFSPGEACQVHVNGYFCLQAALEGPASFCRFPDSGNVGLWWYNVGNYYCGGN